MMNRILLCVLMICVAMLPLPALPSPQPYNARGSFPLGPEMKCFGRDCLISGDGDEVDVVLNSRRLLKESEFGYISYGALERNRIPCNKSVRGNSYYDCRRHERANPYRRNCTRATRCARNNH